jgi:multiple sugar transport system permease protein
VSRPAAGRTIAGIGTAGVLLAGAAFFVIPVVWLLLAVTKTDTQLTTQPPFTFGSLGAIVTAWNHVVAFENGAIFTWLGNSVLYSGVALVLSLLVCIPAGYALAHLEFRGRKTVLISTLIIMFVPTSALVLPTFLELSALGLVGTAWSVILPFTFFPFGVYLAFIYFSTSIPPTLIQAARIDGCSDWQVFRHIAVPLSTPIIGLVGFFGFVANWNNYFLPFIMLGDDQDFPVQVGLKQMIAASPAFSPGAGGAQLNILRPELALAAILTVLPVLFIFLFSQRTLVAGLTAGATKE